MAGIDILDLVEATEVNETTDYLAIVDKSDTSQDVTGSTKRATVRKLLGDRVLPDTIVGTTETQTLTDKTLSTGSVIDANVNVVEVLKKAYPIGSVYINASNATNPASLLGFGTWSAFGAGKVMVGLDAGDTSFDTLGETGGEKTHILTVAEMPAHKHKFGYTGGNTDATGSPYSVGKAIGHDPSNVYSETTSTGGDGSHNNLQPYIVVYFWKRTA